MMSKEGEKFTAVGKQLAELAYSFININEIKELISNVLKTKEMKELISYLEKTLLRMFFDHPEPKETTVMTDEPEKKE